VSSDIIVVSVDGKTSQNLTATDNKIEMYPEVSADGGSIVYHTPNGEIFLMKLKNK
jgi:Tol biopolymer transport system component